MSVEDAIGVSPAVGKFNLVREPSGTLLHVNRYGGVIAIYDGLSPTRDGGKLSTMERVLLTKEAIVIPWPINSGRNGFKLKDPMANLVSGGQVRRWA